MIKVSAIHEAALLIAIHVGVVVSTVTLELQTMQYPSDLYADLWKFWLRRPPPDPLPIGIQFVLVNLGIFFGFSRVPKD